jgi:hypothetical protein
VATGNKRKCRNKNEEILKRVEVVAPIENNMKEIHIRWSDHVQKSYVGTGGKRKKQYDSY